MEIQNIIQETIFKANKLFEAQLEELEQKHPGAVQILADLGYYIQSRWEGNTFILEMNKPWVQCEEETMYHWVFKYTKYPEYYWMQCNKELGHEGKHENEETGGTWE